MVPVLVGCFSGYTWLSSTNREASRQIGVGAKPWEELFYSLDRVVVLWKHLQLQGLYEMPLCGLGLVAAVCWAHVCEGRAGAVPVLPSWPLLFLFLWALALVTANAAQSSLSLLGTPELYLPLLGPQGLGCGHQAQGESSWSMQEWAMGGQLSLLPSSQLLQL